MNKLNISVSTSFLHLLALLFLCIICISAENVDTISSYQYVNNNGELKNLLIPDNVFLTKNSNSHPDSASIGSDIDLQYGQVRIIPYKKRTIPIELQKALYAHGIVGRRR